MSATITATCPRCGDEVEDLDGFGVVAHERCGYCSHASIDGDTCNLCGCVLEAFGEHPLTMMRVARRRYSTTFDSRRVATKRPRRRG